VAIGIILALTSGNVDRGIAEAIADDPENVDELLFKINSARREKMILARHGIT
jgi:hypothetical protein